MAAQKIMICDDQIMIHETLGMYLENEGYEHISAMDGEEALQKFETEKPDLIILDIMMPKLSGTDVCRKLREKSRVPIIMLTAKGEEIDRILGLELGADDYIPKPFRMMELISRVRALLRRSEDNGAEEYRMENLYVCPGRHEVTVDQEPVNLTLKEYEMLCLLLKNSGTVLSRTQLLNQIWGYEFDGESRTVDVHIRTLRQKLGSAGDLVETVRGVGYKISGKCA